MAKIVVEGTRTQTIRTVVLAAFAAVAVVLLGTLALHKLKSRAGSFDFPEKLGANISQTANGFSYSQSQRGHTIFTIHASRIVQFKGEQAELHDVAITLYGPPGSGREDHVAGADFLYDKGSGIATAKGPVSIDLAAPAAGTQEASGKAANAIHVETVGLRFDSKSEQAETAGPLAFTLPRGSGKAVGGSYDSRTGVLVLQSNVELHATENGSPASTFASHAELVRDSHVAYLLQVRSEFAGEHSSADQAILHFRPDGTIQHVDAENHVHVISADGGQLFATNASVDLDARSEPLSASAGGGVNFLSSSPELEMHGNAVEGTMVFAPGPDGKPALHHAQFRNAVSFVLQQNSLGGDARGSATREMTASTLDVEFAPGPGGRSLAESASARGGAKVDLHDLPYGAPARHTTIYGQQLVAKLTNGHELKQLDGSGGTKVADYAPDGATDTTTGDTLQVSFLPESKSRAPLPAGARAQPTGQSAVIATARQAGHVAMDLQPARDAKTRDGSPQQALYADATEARYQAATGMLMLTGDANHPPRVHNDTLALQATELAMQRNSGEVTAQGDVRSTYLNKPAGPGKAAGPSLGGQGAVHATGARAQVARDTGTATFFGSGSTAARLWQGANSVSAPVLEIQKQGGLLHAHGGPDAHGAVHAAFAGQGGAARIAADSLTYSDSTRMADFHGNVVAQQGNGEVRADTAQLFLAEGPSSGLDRLIASGHVVLTQPGRRGSGEKLVYTAADGNYLLTGSPMEPPRASDAQRGATTGAALLFRSGDNGVEVLGRDAEGGSRRTVTDTRTPR